jgi:cytoskeletal protein CcmA (bactofilin family)
MWSIMSINEAKGDLNISGSGTVVGGIFNSVKISGSGKITSDIECSDLGVSGSAHFDGAIKAISMHVSGAAHMHGAIDAQSLKISGAADCDGNADCKYLKASGAFKCGGDLVSENIDISGGLDVFGDINTESFMVTGNFKTNGMLNAGDIDVKVHYSKSTAKEIGGSKISIRKGDNSFAGFIRSVLSLGNPVICESESIEGDEIYLEYTTAKVVRGNVVKLGPGCIIDLVEYKTSYEKANDCIVKEEKRQNGVDLNK